MPTKNTIDGDGGGGGGGGSDDVQIQIQEPILSAIAEYAVLVPHPNHHDNNVDNKNANKALKISPGSIAPHLPSWTLEDIESELTALVSIVPGCIYSFEHVKNDADQQHQQQQQRQQSPKMPVLYLPVDYASYLRSRRIRTTLWGLQKSLFFAAVGAMRVLAAAGILISIALLALFVLALIIALIVAMSSQQQNGGGHTIRRTRGGGSDAMEKLMGLLRTAFWYHYIFGDGHHGMMGGPMMFMNPFGFYGDSSYLYWMVLRNSMRRNRTRRDVAELNDDPPPPPRRQRLSKMLSILDSDNGDDDDDGNDGTTRQATSRSLLGVVDEFLFGPADRKRLGGPAGVDDAWRLRAAVVASRCRRAPIHPAELLPYVDNPPPVPSEAETSSDDISSLVAAVDLSEAMKIVVHFRGAPDRGSSSNKKGCHYTFDELIGGIDRISEGTMGCAEAGMGSHDDDGQQIRRRQSPSIAQGAGDVNGAAFSNSPAATPGTSAAKTAASTPGNPLLLLNILCGNASPSAPSVPSEWRPGVLHDLLFRRNTTSDSLPSHLAIGPTVFTNHSPGLLGACAAVAFVNLLCVHWMEIYGLASNGPLQVGQWPPAVARTVLAVAWLMRWYSFFFVAVPLVRVAFVVLYKNRRRRELRRLAWAEALSR